MENIWAARFIIAIMGAAVLWIAVFTNIVSPRIRWLPYLLIVGLSVLFGVKVGMSLVDCLLWVIGGGVVIACGLYLLLGLMDEEGT